VVKENGLEDRITIIKGKMEEIELPVKKVDIIISEWMGYFLLYEAMLNTVLYARDKYLASDGLILPDRVTLNMVGIQDKVYKEEKYGFWNDIYGYNMQCIKEAALGEPLVEMTDPKGIVTNTCTFFEADLYTIKVEDLTFANKFKLVINKDDTIDALVCWFDTEFSRMKNSITLSTSPYLGYTHWKQTIFYLSTPISMLKDEVLEGSIAVKKSLVHPRSLDIVITHKHIGKESKISYKQLYRFA
jgi:protein arginine N-methyltransferase 1